MGGGNELEMATLNRLERRKAKPMTQIELRRVVKEAHDRIVGVRDLRVMLAKRYNKKHG
jgi:hypothetical protein